MRNLFVKEDKYTSMKEEKTRKDNIKKAIKKRKITGESEDNDIEDDRKEEKNMRYRCEWQKENRS